jgi:hypothetical protein
MHVPLLLPPPLGGRGSSRLLLGPPLPRLVGVDLLLPALLAAKRGVAPTSTKRVHQSQKPERTAATRRHLLTLAASWRLGSYLYMKAMFTYQIWEAKFT